MPHKCLKAFAKNGKQQINEYCNNIFLSQHIKQIVTTIRLKILHRDLRNLGLWLCRPAFILPAQTKTIPAALIFAVEGPL